MQTWAAMEQLVDSGKCKAIGLSNFNSKQIAEIMEKGRIKPAVLQVESHPFFTQEPLIAFCKGHGVQVTVSRILAASPHVVRAGERIVRVSCVCVRVARARTCTYVRVRGVCVNEFDSQPVFGALHRLSPSVR